MIDIADGVTFISAAVAWPILIPPELEIYTMPLSLLIIVGFVTPLVTISISDTVVVSELLGVVLLSLTTEAND